MISKQKISNIILLKKSDYEKVQLLLDYIQDLQKEAFEAGRKLVGEKPSPLLYDTFEDYLKSLEK